MTAIDTDLMQQVSNFVCRNRDVAEWHTLTVTLNGQHGGADVHLEGTDWDSGDEVIRVGTLH